MPYCISWYLLTNQAKKCIFFLNYCKTLAILQQSIEKKERKTILPRSISNIKDVNIFCKIHSHKRPRLQKQSPSVLAILKDQHQHFEVQFVFLIFILLLFYILYLSAVCVFFLPVSCIPEDFKALLRDQYVIPLL